jgi:hypothetical protein
MAYKMLKLYNGEEKKALQNSEAVDPEKLKAEFKKRNLIAADVSRSLGYAGNTISGAMFSGVFPGHMVSGLERQYNIKLDDYRYVPEQQQTPVKTDDAPVLVEETAMYTVMKTAFLDALNECIAGNMKNFRGMVMTAIRQAKE